MIWAPHFGHPSQSAEHLTRAHLSRILNGHAGISAAMSLRLSEALGTSPEFWLKKFGLWQAQRAK